MQAQAATPQKTAAASSSPVTMQSAGRIWAGPFRWSPNYTGTLTLAGNQLTFADQGGNPVVSVTPAQTTSVSVTVGGLTFTSGGVRYSFVPEGARFAQGALVVGGVAGLAAASALSKKAGVPEWQAALTAAGFNPKDMGMGTIAKWVIPITIGFVLLLFIFYVIVGVSSQ